MAAFEEAQKPKEEVVEEKTEEEKKAEAIDRAKSTRSCLRSRGSRPPSSAKRAISASALGSGYGRWEAKKYTTAAGIDVEAYIEENAGRGRHLSRPLFSGTRRRTPRA